MAEVKTAVKTKEKQAPVVKPEVAEQKEVTTGKVTDAKKEVKKEVKKPAAKKPATKKTEVALKTKSEKEIVFLQFDGKTYQQKDLVKIAKDVWVYDLGKKLSDFKTVELYVKPEEKMAYYVINQTESGSFEI